MDYMHYQRYPHIHGDMEPAFVVRPHEPCCPDEKEECVCVTSGDVEKWNDAADMLSALSGVTPEDIEKIDEVLTSATLWNGTYDTVKANSGNWEKTLSAVTANSGIWNKASAISSIQTNLDNLNSAVSALEDITDGKQDKIYFDGTSIIGDGSTGSPYRVYDWPRVSRINKDLTYLYDHITSADISADGKSGVAIITDGAAAAINAINPQLVKLNEFMLGWDTKMSALSDDVENAVKLGNLAISESKTYHGDGDTISIDPKYESSARTKEFVVSLVGLPSGVNADIRKGLEAYNIATALNAKRLLEWAKAERPTSDAGAAQYAAANVIYVC